MRKLARLALSPFTRLFKAFFDWRFAAVEGHIQTASDELSSDLDARLAAGFADHTRQMSAQVSALQELLALTSDRVAAHGHRHEDRLLALEGKLESVLGDIRRPPPSPAAEPGQLTHDEADLLNYSESHLGFRAQEHLWFNHPDVVRYRAGGVDFDHMSERLVEVPFVLIEAARRLRPGASIVDVGCSESLVPLQLAALGYRVTGIDLRPYRLSHPNLSTLAVDFRHWSPGEPVDAIVCLSAIEHFGLGAYGGLLDPQLDRKALEAFAGWIADDGVLLLTTPIGPPSVDDFTRIYGLEQLESLLSGWTIETFRWAHTDGHVWSITDAPAPDGTPGVALVVARRDA